MVNFKNTLIIMPSNRGSPFIQGKFDEMRRKNEGERERILEETKLGVLEMLRQNVRPEFLNRIDDIIMFSPLSQEEIKMIVSLQVESVVKRLAEQGVTLHIGPDVVETIARAGFDPEFGARPVKRALQRLLLNDLSKALLSGAVDKTKPIRVSAETDKLSFSNE